MYEKTIIKKYKYWTLMVALNQSYLGRCIIWCDREDAVDLVDITPYETKEYLEIIRNLKTAVEKAFDADWLNYSFLGNGTRHLHCHFVPRYEKPRTFNGKEFRDELWGGNFLTDSNFETTEDDREKIKTEIYKYLD